MIDLYFKINRKENADNSDIFLNRSYLDRNLKTIDIINFSILNNLEELKKNKNIDDISINETWPLLCNFVNENNFYLKNILLLRKGENFNKWKSNGERLRNIVFNINSENKNLKNNQISFYVDLIKNTNNNSLDEFEVILKRIEFLKINNFKKLVDKQVKLNELVFDDEKQNIDDFKQILDKKKEFVFKNEDFSNDKIKIQEWFDFIKELNNLYDKNNTEEEPKTNFVFSFNGKEYLFSKKEISNISNYELFNETGTSVNEDAKWKIKETSLFNKELNKEVEKINIQIKENEDKIKNQK